MRWLFPVVVVEEKMCGVYEFLVFASLVPDVAS
jgi:hypothetical protein